LERYAALGSDEKDPDFSQKTREIGHPLAQDQHLRPVSPNDGETRTGSPDESRFPVLGAYDLCLKCSHLFNILDARGAISVTERVGVIARVRALAVGIAKAWVEQQKSDANTSEDSEPEPVGQKKQRAKREALSPVG
jgi:hypothetical protein